LLTIYNPRMATRRSASPQDATEDLSDLMGEEEATALAGAPADGYDETPPINPEDLEPVAPPFTMGEEDQGTDPFGYEPAADGNAWANPLGVTDASVSKAQEAARVMREANASLLIHRIEPTEHAGMRTAGYIKRFRAPFSIQDAQVWCADNRGGGRYRYWIMDGGNTIRGGGTFECEGYPKSPEEIKEAQTKTAHFDQQAAMRGDRERELESQLSNERMDRMMQMMMQQRREDQAEMRRLVEKMSDRPAAPSMTDQLAPLLTALSPVLAKLVDRPAPAPPPDHFKEIAVLVERFQSESTRTQREMMERMGKPEKSEQMLYKMLETVMQKQLGVGNHDPMAAVNTAFDKVLPGVVGKILNMATDKALGQGEEEKELTPRFMAEKAASLIENAVDKIAGAKQAQAQAQAQAGPQPVAMIPQGHPLPPGAVPGQPQPVEGWPFDAQEAQQPVQPVTPTAPVPAQAYPAEANPAPPVQQPQPAQPQEQSHVNPEVFAKAIEFLNAGQSGEDLAVWVDDNNEGSRLLSKEAIDYLEGTAPFYLVPFIIEAAPPELAQAFTDPRAKQILTDFCDWFYNTEDIPEGEEEGASPVLGLPPEPAPVAPAPEVNAAPVAVEAAPVHEVETPAPTAAPSAPAPETPNA
jgi:hypothetical protein